MRSKKAHKAAKALVLLSGGLDSRLACKMLEEQLGRGRMECVFFALPFGGGCCNDMFCVLRFAQTQGIRLRIVDCTKGRMLRKYMDMVRKPKFQRGTAMNPCIDCHVFMLKEARRIAKKTGAAIIATGEVLGERPLSQNRPALGLIEREAGLEGRLLRPLSARLLHETVAEKKGWIDRSRLLDMQGRQRKRQIALARKYGITFPMPGGGCLLTDKSFSRRLANFLDGRTGMKEIELARLGRHFLAGRSVIVAGRRHEENIALSMLAKRIRPRPAVLEAEGFMGPTTLVTNPYPASLRKAASITVRYSDAPKTGKHRVSAAVGRKRQVIMAEAMPDSQISELRV